MVFKHFAARVSLHVTGLLVTLAIASYLLMLPGYHAASIIVVLIVAYQSYLLLAYVNKTNAELTRFLDALKFADFSQRFHMTQLGSGFSELGAAFSQIMQRAAASRNEQELELRHLKALVEHVPVPLITIADDNKITLCNNSARRLFGTHSVANVQDLSQFGAHFAAKLPKMALGERLLLSFEVDNMERMLAVQTTQLIQSGRQEKLISLQDIQSELDHTQIKAWQDLVRVLTHEIMNSITPVTSLAKTASALADDARTQVVQRAPDWEDLIDELDDVSNAVETVARRSDTLMNFVTSYRRLTRLPAADKKEVSLHEYLQEIAALIDNDWRAKSIALQIEMEPQGLRARIDSAMVEQLLLNLLKNAEQALEQCPSDKPKVVQISIGLNKRGHMEMTVEDSGPGIDDEIAEQVFVPFFTTKREGSGVGLALTRQVMIAHGGNVRLSRSAMGGAKFTLTF